MNRKLAIDIEINFYNFIDQLLNSPNLIKNGLKQLTLDFSSHSAPGHSCR